MSPERPARPHRWLGRSLVAGAVAVAAGIAVTACGSSKSSSSGSAIILNTEKVERAIEHSSMAQRNRRVTVSCPSGVHQKKGLVFTCTALYKGRSTRFVVTETDGAGQVHYVAR